MLNLACALRPIGDTRYLLNDVFLSMTLTTAEKINALLTSLSGLIAIFVFIWTPLTYIRHYCSIAVALLIYGRVYRLTRES